jgi:hypothetical protein
MSSVAVFSCTSFSFPLRIKTEFIYLLLLLLYRRPMPFHSVLKPRSAKAEALIRSLDLPDF